MPASDAPRTARHRTAAHRTALVLAALVVAGLALAAAARPAAAGSVTTTNACLYSADNYYRDLDVTLTGTGTPNPLPPGEVLTTQVHLEGTMPSWLPQYGYNFGLLQVGENDIPTTIWLAIEASGTAEGSQVVEVDVDAVTVVEDPDGVVNTNDETGTPPAVSVDLPPLTWTATGGPVELRQAGPGTLPTLPGAGARGGDARPEGSLFLGAQLADSTFTLDCQPGEYSQQGESLEPAVATPFETVTEGTATTTTTSSTAAPTTSAPSSTTTTTTAVDAELAASDDDSSSSSPAVPIAIAVVVVLAVTGGGAWWWRSKQATPPST